MQTGSYFSSSIPVFSLHTLLEQPPEQPDDEQHERTSCSSAVNLRPVAPIEPSSLLRSAIGTRPTSSSSHTTVDLRCSEANSLLSLYLVYNKCMCRHVIISTTHGLSRYTSSTDLQATVAP